VGEEPERKIFGDTPPADARRGLKAVALVIALGLVVVAVRFGLVHSLSDTTAQFRAKLLELGVLGYVAYLVTYTVFQPFGLPGLAFTFAAALVWPWPIAFALSMTGALTASSAGFAFARFVAREAVERRLPPRFLKYDKRLETHGFSTVFVLRVLFLMSPILHGLFGVSKVPFKTHLASSAAAYAVPIFLICYFGERAIEYLEHAPPAHYAVALLVVVKLALVTFYGGRYVKRRSARRLQAAAAEVSDV